MLWAAGFFFLLFVVRVLLDPRTMRAGVYLLLSLSSLAVWAGLETLIWLSQWDEHGNAAGWFFLIVLGLSVVMVLVLAVMLILNGVAMWRREGHSLGNLLSLIVGVVFLGEIAAAVAAVMSTEGLLMAWTAVAILPTGYFGFGFLAYALYSALYQWGTRVLGRPVYAVVVLGSGLIGGRVPPLLASRLNRGRAVLEKSMAYGRDPVIVVSGGQGGDEERSEAEAMAEYLVAAGVKPDAIIQENRSRNTKENITNTELMLTDRGVEGRVAVVTNNFHAFRSALLMRQRKMRGYVIGSPTASYYWPSAAIREFVAIVRDHPWFTVVVLALTWLPILTGAIWFTLEAVNLI